VATYGAIAPKRRMPWKARDPSGGLDQAAGFDAVGLIGSVAFGRGLLAGPHGWGRTQEHSVKCRSLLQHRSSSD
jgi:hypothetical protein